MKKTLLVIPVLLVLAACGEPIPQEQWKQGEVNMTAVAGFEDCKMATFKRTTGSDPIHVIRCPGASTTAQYSVSHGKSGRKYYNNTVVDEADPVDALRAKKIAEAEVALKQAQAQLERLKAE